MGHHGEDQILAPNHHLANSREHIAMSRLVRQLQLFHPSTLSFHPVLHMEEKHSLGGIDKKAALTLERGKLSPRSSQRLP